MKRYVLLLCIVAVLRNSEALRKGSTDYEGLLLYFSNFELNSYHDWYSLATKRMSDLSSDMSFWLKSGQETLHRILAEQKNENRAKNVIIFIGDGMGLSTITSGRIYTGQLNGYSGEEYQLAFEKFPNTALAKVHIQIASTVPSLSTARSRKARRYWEIPSR